MSTKVNTEMLSGASPPAAIADQLSPIIIIQPSGRVFHAFKDGCLCKLFVALCWCAGVLEEDLSCFHKSIL